MLTQLAHATYYTPMENKGDIRREQKQWLAGLTDRTGLTLSQIAKKAGVVSTTLTRFYNSTDTKHVLSSVTRQKIETAFPTNPENSNDTYSKGLMEALQTVIFAISREVPIMKHLESALNYQMRELRQQGRQAEAEVLDEVLDFLHAGIPKELTAEARLDGSPEPGKPRTRNRH